MDDLSEDKVWFVDDPAAWDSGEIISRTWLPDEAVRLSIEFDGSTLFDGARVPGAEDRMYEVWAVDRG
ncbi:hypothetical protein LJR044_002494 [Microbacterium foliorum]